MRFRLITRQDDYRGLASVPWPVHLLAVAALALQLYWHGIQPGPRARAEDLPGAPSLQALRLVSLGEPTTLAKLLMLWLQAFDYQSGITIPFQDLDPERLKPWLSRMLDLDPRGQYPLLAASRFYADVPAENSQRQMSEFVYEKFLEDPDRRWPWLGHVAIIAKHRTKDLALALKYARALAEHARGPGVPPWAQQMELVVLEEMGELEAARIYIGGLLSSGQVTHPKEIHFLIERLKKLESGRLEEKPKL